MPYCCIYVCNTAMFIFGQALLQPLIGAECDVSFTLALMSHDKTSQLHNIVPERCFGQALTWQCQLMCSI